MARVEVPVGRRYRIDQAGLLLPVEAEAGACPGCGRAQTQAPAVQVDVGSERERYLQDAVTPADKRMQRAEHGFDTSDRQLPRPPPKLGRGGIVKRWHQRGEHVPVVAANGQPELVE
jgi:hypothetical protein